MSHIAVDAPVDRRVRKTQEALFAAFRELFFAHGFEAISIGDIVARADVGRSTFYKHFEGKDDILTQSMGQFLEVIAESCVRPHAPEALTRVVEHFWEQRRHARTVFAGEALEVVSRALSAKLEPKLLRLVPTGEAPRLPVGLAACAIASGQLMLLQRWLLGRGSAPAPTLAAGMHASGYASACAMMRG
jgi:AcrR family transcriptional regulator